MKKEDVLIYKVLAIDFGSSRSFKGFDINTFGYLNKKLFF